MVHKSIRVKLHFLVIPIIPRAMLTRALQTLVALQDYSDNTADRTWLNYGKYALFLISKVTNSLQLL